MSNSVIFTITPAIPGDASEILALQKLAFESEARFYDDWTIPPMTQTLEELKNDMPNQVFLKALSGDRIIGSIRARAESERCEIGRLIVHPDYQGQGIGTRLLNEIERYFPHVARFCLFTGSQRESNLRLYRRNGYVVTHTKPLSPKVTLAFLEKANSPS